MDVGSLLQKIDQSCTEYVNAWRSPSNPYIQVPPGAYLEGNITPIEGQFCVHSLLARLHREDHGNPEGIHALPFDALRRLPVPLTRTVDVQINQDHYLFWAWTAEVVLSRRIDLPTKIGLPDLRLPLSALFHVVLASTAGGPSPEGLMLQRVPDVVLSNHIREIVLNKMLIATPLSFVCLEMIVRNYCSAYVDDKGVAIQPFQVGARKVKAGDDVMLNHLLQLFEGHVLPSISDMSVRSNFGDMNATIETTWGSGQSWISVMVRDWRNAMLHGKNTWLPKAFGVATNYVCLLLWNLLLEIDYAQELQEILRLVRRNLQIGPDSSWSYYPP